MYGGLDVSVSGMVAQRTRLNTIAANLANRSTLLDAEGNYSPYRRRVTVLAEGDPSATRPGASAQGVHVRSIDLDMGEFQKRYEPNSPYADESGYVQYPNIDSMTETVNMLDAQRAYEANVAAAEASKAMVAQALRIIA
jgi:flagellar basal-body rod protein FlgC